MKKFLLGIMFTFLLTTNILFATTVNGRFVILDKTTSTVSILLQLNTNTGIDDIGGATIVVGFDSSLISLPNIPRRNIDYYFHNCSGANYSLATVTKPEKDMVWINIDLPFNKSNNGDILSKDPNWTDIVTINFSLINSADSISIYWLTSSLFWGIFDGNNTEFWSTGFFENFSEKLNFDTTPPMLIDAILLDPQTLELTFSEPIDSISGTDESNYNISNNITVQYASISNYKDVVTLITDSHSNGSNYTITTENIVDLAGNLINSQYNNKEYFCFADSSAPEITSVTVQNNKTLTVNFSERVDYNSAANKNNYSISNNIDVTSVQVLPDSSGAMLKTSRQNNNSEYTLTVENIKDRAGNNINPNPSSKNYTTPRKGKGNSTPNTIILAKSNSWFQYYTPDKTIDTKGMMYPDSRWQSSETMPVDIVFELDKNSSFDSLRISFHKWETGKTFQYSVYTSMDSINWFPVLEESWSENSEWTELNIDSVETKFMKLSLLKSSQGPYASIWEVEMFGTDSDSSDEGNNSFPNAFKLLQNYPNPFNPSTKISYEIPERSFVTIKIYDVLGNEITTLVNEEKQSNNYVVEFDGSGLTSGIYFYQIKVNSFVETKKMILLK